jgi:V8-like Glu-specific endopeptidase
MGNCCGSNPKSNKDQKTPSNTRPSSPKSVLKDSDSEVQSFLGFDSKPPVKSNKQRALKVSISGKAAEERYGEEKSMQRIVPGKDGRQIVTNSEVWPNCVHGRLCTKFEGENFVGSGTLIGPRYVITAAHNIYDKKKRKECDKDSVVFYPGISGKSCPYGMIRVVSWHYPPEYQTEGNEDYALLILEKDVGKYTGYFGLRPHNRTDLNNMEFSLYGYPATMEHQNSGDHYLWGM